MRTAVLSIVVLVAILTGTSVMSQSARAQASNCDGETFVVETGDPNQPVPVDLTGSTSDSNNSSATLTVSVTGHDGVRRTSVTIQNASDPVVEIGTNNSTPVASLSTRIELDLEDDRCRTFLLRGNDTSEKLSVRYQYGRLHLASHPDCGDRTLSSSVVAGGTPHLCRSVDGRYQSVQLPQESLVKTGARLSPNDLPAEFLQSTDVDAIIHPYHVGPARAELPHVGSLLATGGPYPLADGVSLSDLHGLGADLDEVRRQVDDLKNLSRGQPREKILSRLDAAEVAVEESTLDRVLTAPYDDIVADDLDRAAAGIAAEKLRPVETNARLLLGFAAVGSVVATASGTRHYLGRKASKQRRRAPFLRHGSEGVNPLMIVASVGIALVLVAFLLGKLPNIVEFIWSGLT